MFIKQVRVSNFRCFSDYTVQCDAPITLIQGSNGSGKTSILEALYYAAYLRSFRTPHPAEMITFDAQAFTIGIDGESYDGASASDKSESWHLHIGCSHKKRLVKKNKQPVASYKELLHFYRVMHIIEDDMEIIKGGPKSRRSFIDQSIMLHNYAYAQTLRAYKKTVAQRNALLFRGNTNDTIWLKQMWSYAHEIVSIRCKWLQRLEKEANALLSEFFPETQIHLEYAPKHTLHDDFDTFYSDYIQSICNDEIYSKRARFGPHLDDIHMYLQKHATRMYASRGQQKLVMVIIKLAAIRLVEQPVLLLIDDMFADFDSDKIQRLLSLLAHKSYQIIMTAPGTYPHLEASLQPYTYHTVSISDTNKA